ncbi:MAG: hypothetical protein NZ844_01940 [Chloroherpetonaceae bacterium]|nr:hypothetical protein [Chloroherpetonaceae bacterium]
MTSLSALKLADANPAFDFLKDEPDLYGEDDVKPENRNPKHRSRLNWRKNLLFCSSDPQSPSMRS